HSGAFHSEQVLQGSDGNFIACNRIGRLYLSQGQTAKKTDFHAAFSRLDFARQCIRALLGDRLVLEVSNRLGQLERLKRAAREEIEVDTFPVPQPQRQRRAAVKNEIFGRRLKLAPEQFLAFGKDVQIWNQYSHGMECSIRKTV